MMNKLDLKTAAKIIGILFSIGICSVILGAIFLLAAFYLPNEKITKNAVTCLSSFNKEAEYYVSMPGYSSSVFDNVTDAVYIAQAMVGIDQDGILENTFGGYNYYSTADESKSMLQKLSDYYAEAHQPYIEKESTHVRFWNGYLVWLKPALCLFTYGTLRMINMISQGIILFLLLFLMHEKKLKEYEMPFLLSYLLFNPVSVAMNLFFSGFFYCGLIPCIVVLLFDDYLKKGFRYIFFFEISGIVVAYFNMNSFQLITWGFPLVFVFLLSKPKGIGMAIRMMTMSFLSWLCGYAGMIISKWIIAGIFTKVDVSETVGNSLKTRLSDTTPMEGFERIGRLDGLKNNLNTMLQNKVWLCVEVLFIIVIIVLIIRKGFQFGNVTKMWIVLLTATIIITFSRYVLLLNHSFIHCNYVFRNLAIPVFVLNCGLMSALQVSRSECVKEDKY